MSTERWRCSIGAPLGDALRRDLAAAVERWRGRDDLDGLRWTDPAVWHLTLAFLGSVDPAEMPGIIDHVGSVSAEAAPAALPTGGLGAFPSAARARVVWYGVGDADGAAAGLARSLTEVLGLGVGGPFRGHITLARAPRRPVDMRSWLQNDDAPAGELLLDRLDVMRSHLGSGPAGYECLASIPLGAHAHV